MTDRTFGRDYPIILGVKPCPVCEEYVSTEYRDGDEDPDVKRWGDVYFHTACVPPDLKECAACGELEEVKRLDENRHCWRCKTPEMKTPPCKGGAQLRGVS
jgi:hypothetical protein